MSAPLTEQDLKDIEARSARLTHMFDIQDAPAMTIHSDDAYAVHDVVDKNISALLAEVQRQKDIAAAERALRVAVDAFWDGKGSTHDCKQAEDRLRALGVDP